MLPLILLILTGSVGALVVSREAGSSPIKVSISSTGNTEIKAVLFNAGNAPLKLLNSGTLLDHAPVNKVHVEKSSKRQIFPVQEAHWRFSEAEAEYTHVSRAARCL